MAGADAERQAATAAGSMKKEQLMFEDKQGGRPQRLSRGFL